MAVTLSNIVAGITRIQIIKDSTYATATWSSDPAAAFITEFGAESAGTTTAKLVDLSSLQGPAVVEYSCEHEKIEIEQDTFFVKHLLKAESLTVKFNLAESIFWNLQVGIAGMADPASATVGPGVIGPVSAGAATSTIHHYAIKIVSVGTAVATPVRRIIIPKAYATGNMGVSFTKSGIQMIPCEFSAVRGQETGGDMIPVGWIVDAAS